jgi:hypothetical protein
MMADDVIFMVPGQEPFCKEAFAANSARPKNVRIDGSADILENSWPLGESSKPY